VQIWWEFFFYKSALQMKQLTSISALFGAVATVALVQPYTMALTTEQVKEIAKQVTVQIDGQAPGSGVIVAQDGQTYYVLTAAHVVPSADEYEVVTADRQRYKVNYNLVKKLPNVDLALVPFTSANRYSIVSIGSSAQMKAGATSFLSGFPQARAEDAANQQAEYRFTKGQIVAVASRPISGGYALAYGNPTFAGMSGGPVFDQDGKLIGIHGASKTKFNENQGINPRFGAKEGLSLGIPVETFLRLAPQIAANLKLPTAPPLATASAQTADDFLIQGVDQRDSGNIKAAVAAFDQAIRLRPNYAVAYHTRGFSHFSLGDYKGAITDLTQAIRLDPEYAHISYNLRGMARGESGDLQGAIADYSEAIRLAPKDAYPYNNRGSLNFNTGKIQSAIADFTEAIRISPNFVLAYSNRGRARHALGDHQGALADFEQAIRLEPTLAPAYGGRGIVRLALGDAQGALADFDQAIRLSPKMQEPYINRGRARAELGNSQGAMADFDQAIRLDPKNALAYSNRGLLKARSGDRQGAMADYEQALRLNPKLTDAYFNRGSARRVSGDNQGAMADFNQAIQLDPNLALAYIGRATSYSGTGSQPAIIADLKQAAKLAQQQGNQKVYQLAVQTLTKLGVSFP
jgi:tetratricopeptide (TPR) repeat protein